MRAPLRVGFDLRRMHRSGIGRYARNVFAAVVAEAPAHEYLAVVQGADDAAWAARLGARVRTLVAPAAQYTPQEMLRVPAGARGVDVWHSPHPYQLGLGGPPVVLTLHDTIQLSHAMGAANRLARGPIAAILLASTRRARGLVAVSDATREAFRDWLRVPPSRVRVAPLAPDPALAAAPTAAAVAEARARWGLPARLALYIGMTQPHKNLPRLLDALARVVREPGGADVALAIAGPWVPAQQAPLRARVAALGLAPHVRFLGTLTDAELGVAYHLADVVVQPSLVEGFGLTVLEAMQAGTPVVASDIPAFREIAGDAARLVDPHSPASIADGLRAVLDDPARAAALARLGRAAARRFDWRATARATLAAYADAAR